jgi:hypothetical protein
VEVARVARSYLHAEGSCKYSFSCAHPPVSVSKAQLHKHEKCSENNRKATKMDSNYAKLLTPKHRAFPNCSLSFSRFEIDC